MTALVLSLLSSPTLLAILGGVIAVVGAFIKGRLDGAKKERTKQRAKEADAYERHLQDIADAADARNSVDPRGVPDDPHNRDR